MKHPHLSNLCITGINIDLKPITEGQQEVFTGDWRATVVFNTVNGQYKVVQHGNSFPFVMGRVQQVIEKTLKGIEEGTSPIPQPQKGAQE